MDEITSKEKYENDEYITLNNNFQTHNYYNTCNELHNNCLTLLEINHDESTIKLSENAIKYLKSIDTLDIDFVTVFGNENSGKSLLLNLLINYNNDNKNPWKNVYQLDNNKHTNISEINYNYFHLGSTRRIIKNDLSKIVEIVRLIFPFFSLK